MKVYFIGAGPGAPDLLTLRAVRILQTCPICLYAGALVPPEVLTHVPDTAEKIDSRHLSLEQIDQIFRRARQNGQDIARLHSGDPSVFSALAEQVRLLTARRIAFEIVPGVPAYAAAAARLQTELTVPGLSQTVILTRIGRRGSALPERERLAGLAEHRATLVLHLSVADIEQIVHELVPVYGPDCPAAVAAHVSQPGEILVEGRLAELDCLTKAAMITRTAVIMIGPALHGHPVVRSAVYDNNKTA